MAVGTLTAFGQRNVEEIRREFLDTDSRVVLVASHRAVHHYFPENSLPAVREAIRLGIDIVEIDVKVSKDGVPFLMHDRTMDRTTTGKGDPEEFTFIELQKLRLVANGKETNEKIPALQDVLNLAKGHIMIDLDLKTDRLDAIMAVVKKTGTQNIAFFFDSDYEALAEVEQADADYMLMPRAYSEAMADSAIIRFGPEVVHIDSKFYTPEVTRLIKGNKARIWINALGEPDQKLRSGKVEEALSDLLRFGANIVQTDEPELLLDALKKAGRH
ncbi:glycerophosphoryl diester phosphodiesterase [Persicitalea jodogahamensis]|uniref:Glycerophosphoryl diester phosphodiesterase n=2 Tax=Persicitalea jodogahamensis TaxID=402147 RepID=A0A8J3D0Z4_9BACT|nr:glycerophosphoryl diester phosphodiesterase [Persicitalea jodogahamensis]